MSNVKFFSLRINGIWPWFSGNEQSYSNNNEIAWIMSVSYLRMMWWFLSAVGIHIDISDYSWVVVMILVVAFTCLTWGFYEVYIHFICTYRSIRTLSFSAGKNTQLSNVIGMRPSMLSKLFLISSDGCALLSRIRSHKLTQFHCKKCGFFFLLLIC